MAQVVLPTKAAAVSPLKVSQAMGASLAFLGLERAMPLEHGARGCTALSKLFFMRHFREPIALQTTAMEEFTTILGADDNVVEALRTICVKDQPGVIGLISTGLAETQGADVPRTLQEFRTVCPQFAHVAVVPVSAPDTPGCLETGYAIAVTAIIEALVTAAAPVACRPRQVNLLASPMLTTGDVEAVREWIEAFDLHPVVLPDLASSLDGHLIEEGYSSLTYGGTSLADIATMGASVATLVIGPSLGSAATVLEERTGVPSFHFPGLMGLAACDAFTDALRQIAEGPGPERVELQRARLLDTMVDCHFVLGEARLAVAADPDLLGQLTRFLTGMGATVVAAVAAAAAPALADLPLDRVIVGDLEDLEDAARPHAVHALVTNSHGVQTAARLGVPLLRAGFPQHDHFGGHARTWVGYLGTRQALFDFANVFSVHRRQIPAYRSRFRQPEGGVAENRAGALS